MKAVKIKKAWYHSDKSVYHLQKGVLMTNGTEEIVSEGHESKKEKRSKERLKDSELSESFKALSDYLDQLIENKNNS